jgi:hypothetical protein
MSLLVLLVGMLVPACSSGGGNGQETASVPPTTIVSPTETGAPTTTSSSFGITGTLTRRYEQADPEGTAAADTGGCADLVGLTVTITDGEGLSLGSAQTSAATNGPTSTRSCAVTFTVEVPQALRYGIQVGDRPGTTYDFQELQANDFSVGLSEKATGAPPFAAGDVDSVTAAVLRQANKDRPGEVNGVSSVDFFLDPQNSSCPSGEMGAPVVDFASDPTSGVYFFCLTVSGAERTWGYEQGPLYGE